MKSRLVWLLLCGIWGSTWLFIKLGLDDLPPVSFAGIRFLLASLILLGLMTLRGLSLPNTKRDWLLLVETGILSFSLNYGLIFWGEQFISSGLAALLQATIPAFGMVIAHLYLPSERLTGRKLCGVVLGVAGVGTIFSNQLSIAGSRALAGSGALVLSAICVAYGNVLVKAHGGELQPMTLAAGQMLIGLVPLLLLGLLIEGSPMHFRWTIMSLVALIYLAIVGSVAAFILYYWLVQHMDVTKTMLIALVTPVFAVVLGMLVLNEKLNWRTLAGGVMIISGIALVVLKRREKIGQTVASGTAGNKEMG